MNTTTAVSISLAASLLALCHASAATINFAGSVEGVQVTDWRTTSTAKTLDIDGNNFYGTYGAVHWTVAGVNQQGLGSATPGWGFVGSGGQFTNAGYPDIDHVNNFPTNTDGTISLSSFTFEMTGVTATYLNQTVRVGIMADMLTSGEWAADQNKGFQITQTVGGAGDSGIISLRSGGAGNGVPEMYFFDLTGVNPGDRFQIAALNNVSGAGVTQAGYLGPVSWDVIPEPSTVILGGLGLIPLLQRRRNA